MREDVLSILSPEQSGQPCAYQVVETIQAIAQAAQAAIVPSVADVAIVKLALHFREGGQAHPLRARQEVQGARYLLHNLRSLVRKTDSVFLLHHAFYFVLPGANLQGGSIVEERLWDALLWRIHDAQQTQEVCIASLQRVTAGHSACPWPSGAMASCLHTAGEVRRDFTFYREAPEGEAAEQPDETASPQSEERELRTLARELGIPYLPSLPRKLSTRVQRLVSPQLAQELRCYPLGRERDMLTVAMSNPQDRHALARLQQETGLHIFPVLAPPHELQTALEDLV